MDRYVGSPVIGRFTGRLQFVQRVLSDVERIVGSGRSSAGHHFDLTGSETEILPNRGQNVRATISDEIDSQ